MIDHKLLKQARANVLRKEAFNPMTPEAQAAAAQQGAAPPPPGMDPMAMGGAPPMDPSMMGGAPPMDPSMMGGAPPMDPSMMGGGMPMDPMAMGGGMPMDPSMMDPAAMGGAPPEDPAAAGTPVQLTLEDLRQVLKEIDGEESADPDKPKRATNAQIMDEIASLKEIVTALAAAQGIQLPAGDVGAGASMAPGGDAGSPDDIASIAAEMSSMGAEGGAPDMGMDPMSAALDMGLPPGEMPPGAMPKMAVDKWTRTRLGRRG